MKVLKTFLKRFPTLVIFLLSIIRLFKRLRKHKSFKRIFLHKSVIISKMTEKKISFFGYYNITPFNRKGDVLFHEALTSDVRGSLVMPVDLCLNSNNDVINFGKSLAWNWQQGCMLQWYAGSDNMVIYNDYSVADNQYISVIQDFFGKKTIIDRPIYSVAKSGEFALSLNFDRLAIMRPDYGYFNRNQCVDDLPSDIEDGIWHVDLKLNTHKLIITLQQLKEFEPNHTMTGAQHKVNHIDISPNGKQFMFLHRWIGPQGRFMRLFTAKSQNGEHLNLVTGNTMVSHSCWVGDTDIYSFCRVEGVKDKYAHFNDTFGYVNIVGDNYFNQDGHPSVSPDGKWMLTDEYPDKTGFSKLYIFNLNNENRIEIGKFYQPIKYNGENRIDLHPRWSVDGKTVSIDSGHNGFRSMYTIDVSNIV